MVLTAILGVFSLSVSATTAQINGQGSGSNIDGSGQNINSSCTGFNTGGLQAQVARTVLNCVNSICSGSISYAIAATQQAIGLTILQLALSGGTFEGPFGIAGAI